MTEDAFKEKIISIVRKYQSGCLNNYVSESIDESLSMIPVCKQSTPLPCKCLDADELAVLYTYIETRGKWSGVKLLYSKKTLDISRRNLSGWLEACETKDCHGLNIPVTDEFDHTQKCDKFLAPLFSIAFFTHNLHRGQSVTNPDKEIEERISRLAKPFLFYISILQVNTFVFGYYAIFKSLLGNYIAEQKSTRSPAKNHWEEWNEWIKFKDEITVIKKFWLSEKPQSENFFSKYFVQVEKNEQTFNIWGNLYSFLGEYDRGFKDARDRKEFLIKQRDIVKRIAGLFLNTESLMIQSSNKEKDYKDLIKIIDKYINEVFINIEE